MNSGGDLLSPVQGMGSARGRPPESVRNRGEQSSVAQVRDQVRGRRGDGGRGGEVCKVFQVNIPSQQLVLCFIHFL